MIELKVTPNRADCLGIKGIAREVAALTRAADPTHTDCRPCHPDRHRPALTADTACGRYFGAVFKG